MLLVNIRGESKFELFKTTNFLKGLLINKKETCSMSKMYRKKSRTVPHKSQILKKSRTVPHKSQILKKSRTVPHKSQILKKSRTVPHKSQILKTITTISYNQTQVSNSFYIQSNLYTKTTQGNLKMWPSCMNNCPLYTG
jgi:hypothetical protein